MDEATEAFSAGGKWTFRGTPLQRLQVMAHVKKWWARLDGLKVTVNFVTKRRYLESGGRVIGSTNCGA
ncbi:hypothetical protein OAX78_03565, partial [Planctomycetota bacterium]|nr:hypothetical protein [Planctomycetota bacterium]